MDTAAGIAYILPDSEGDVAVRCDTPCAGLAADTAQPCVAVAITCHLNAVRRDAFYRQVCYFHCDGTVAVDHDVGVLGKRWGGWGKKENVNARALLLWALMKMEPQHLPTMGVCHGYGGSYARTRVHALLGFVALAHAVYYYIDDVAE